MMLPIRISVSVTPAAWAGVDANNNAAKTAGSSHFIFVFINAASNAKLTGARDAYPAITMIAPETVLLKSNVVAAVGWAKARLRRAHHRSAWTDEWWARFALPT